ASAAGSRAPRDPAYRSPGACARLRKAIHRHEQPPRTDPRAAARDPQRSTGTRALTADPSRGLPPLRPPWHRRCSQEASSVPRIADVVTIIHCCRPASGLSTSRLGAPRLSPSRDRDRPPPLVRSVAACRRGFTAGIGDVWLICLRTAVAFGSAWWFGDF